MIFAGGTASSPDRLPDEASHLQMLQAKQTNSNNVLWKRKHQLDEWHASEMNMADSKRRPRLQYKVQFCESDIFLSACVSGDEDEVEELINSGTDINTCNIDGVTALHQAVIDDKFDTVKFLIEHGADINAQDNEGWTPLHAAVCCANVELIEYLCNMGADLTIVNSDWELPIDLAKDGDCKGYLEGEYAKRKITHDECRDREFKVIKQDCAKWIATGKFEDRPHQRSGATALHVAAAKNYAELIVPLLKAGADVNARDFDGWTPLHAAAHWGHLLVCKLLLEHGASLEETNFAGDSVLRVADETIVDELKEIESQLVTSSTGSFASSPSREVSVESKGDSEMQTAVDSVCEESKEAESDLVSSSTGSGSLCYSTSASRETSVSAAESKESSASPNVEFTVRLKPTRAGWLQDGKRADAKQAVGAIVTPLIRPSPSSSSSMSSSSPVQSPMQRKSISSPASTPPPWVPLLRSSTDSGTAKPIYPLNPLKTKLESAVPSESVSPRPKTLRISSAPAIPVLSTSRSSCQTPPMQPSQKDEREAERKAKSRIQRSTRRSTQAITAEDLDSAHSWKSSTLSKEGSVDSDQESIHKESRSSATESSSNSSVNVVVDSATNVATGDSMLSPGHMPSPESTPSAAHLRRRSHAKRGTRRGTGPVVLDDVLAASYTISDGAGEVNGIAMDVPNPCPPKQDGPDYRRLYELEMKNKDKLLEEIREMSYKLRQAELEITKLSRAKSPCVMSPTSPGEIEIDKRTYDRTIEELKHVKADYEQIRTDNKRLKEENAALIRVISKLSKY